METSREERRERERKRKKKKKEKKKNLNPRANFAGKNGKRGASNRIGDKQSAQGEWSTILVSKRWVSLCYCKFEQP